MTREMKEAGGLLFLIILSMGCVGEESKVPTTKPPETTSTPMVTVESFEECHKAGYPVTESHPRQCRTPDGRTFEELEEPPVTEDEEGHPKPSNEGFEEVEEKVSVEESSEDWPFTYDRDLPDRYKEMTQEERQRTLESMKQFLRTNGIKCEFEEPQYTAAHSMVINPEDTKTLYVGAGWRGVIKSTDGGKTWKDINNGILVYPDRANLDKPCYNWIGILAMDPTNPDHILVSPTELVYGTLKDPYSETGGIWETFDGGNSWHQIIADWMNAGGEGALAFDPNNPKTIYYGTGHDTAGYWEADPKKLYHEIGVLYKTIDGGKNWEELPTGLLPGLMAKRVFVDTKNSDNILLVGNAHTHIYHKDGYIEVMGKEQLTPMKSSDGGYTWTTLVDNLPPDYNLLLEGDVAKNNFDHIFVRPFRWGEDSPQDVEQKSFYSLDGGQTFSETGMDMPVARYDPHDPQGNHLFGYAPHEPNRLVESFDGGKTWKALGVPDPFYHVEDFVWDPMYKDTVYMLARYETIYKSTDSGKNWEIILDSDKLSKQIGS